MNKTIDQISQLNAELKALDAKLERHEERPDFDYNNHQYQRYLYEKKLKLETLCKLRILYAERETGQTYTAKVKDEGSAPVSFVSQSTVGFKSSPPTLSDALFQGYSDPSSQSVVSEPQHNHIVSSTASLASTQLLPTIKDAATVNGAKRPRDSDEPKKDTNEQIIEHSPPKWTIDTQFEEASKEVDEIERPAEKSSVAVAEGNGATQSLINVADDNGTSKKRRLPDLQIDAYNECKKKVGNIMKQFAEKKVVLVSKVDDSDVSVDKYKTIKEQVAAGSPVTSLIHGTMMNFVVAVDRRNGEFTEKGVFVPDYRVTID